MNTIFEACDRLNVEINLYSTSGNYAGEMRWNCRFEGGDDEGLVRAEASGVTAQAAVELAWHRFQRIAKGQTPVTLAISAS